MFTPNSLKFRRAKKKRVSKLGLKLLIYVTKEKKKDELTSLPPVLCDSFSTAMCILRYVYKIYT